MNERRTLLFLIIVSVLLGVLIAVSCNVMPPTPRPTRPSTDTEVPPTETFPAPVSVAATPLSRGPELEPVELSPGQDLVPNQIIVTGPGPDIDRVIGELPELGLRAVTTTTFEYLEQYIRPDIDFQGTTRGKRLRTASMATISQQQISSLRIILFEFTENTPPLPTTLDTIASKVEELENQLQVGVVAEPNYVMGFELTGDPWGVEGSPWGVEGSPWGVEGSPGEGSTVTHASDYFWQQWALQSTPYGLNLIVNGNSPSNRTWKDLGAGVTIAVFDTSPFDGPGGYRFDGYGPPRFPSLALTVSEPVVLPVSSPASAVNPVTDHGLFVAGLAYAIAPESQIHLVKVLNDYGQGTLQAFIDALNLYMQESLPAQGGSLQKTVINLSLGTAQPDEEELPPEAREAIQRMIDVWGYDAMSDSGTPVFSLEVPMIIAKELGASIVAASGNDSADATIAGDPPLPSQLPAAYPLVIGVEASNQTPTRSCYANEGDLAAPGGDGDSSCAPAMSSCMPDDSQCAYGVISYTMDAHQGFAFWVGTSFATPLVSGLTALVIEEGGTLDPATVQQIVNCSVSVAGVVDVEKALNSCP